MEKELTNKQKASFSLVGGRFMLSQVIRDLTLKADETADCSKLASHLAALLSVETYLKSKQFGDYPDERLAYIKNYLEKLRLDVIVNDKGSIKAEVQPQIQDMAFYQLNKLPDETDPNVHYYKVDGNTYYCIKNLNFYLTVDVVHQLNMNPQQVITMINDQIKEEIAKIEKSGSETQES